ncbi:hypothetical protein CJ307_35620, partial [Klebsiella quasipneumoniae]
FMLPGGGGVADSGPYHRDHGLLGATPWRTVGGGGIGDFMLPGGGGVADSGPYHRDHGLLGATPWRTVGG